MKIGNLITAVIGAVVGLALLPIVSTSVAEAEINATPTIIALLRLVPLLYVVVIVVGMIAYVVVTKSD